MDEAPPNKLSFVRKSFFQAVAKCEMRSWKSLLSILISAIVTDEMADSRANWCVEKGRWRRRELATRKTGRVNVNGVTTGEADDVT